MFTYKIDEYMMVLRLSLFCEITDLYLVLCGKLAITMHFYNESAVHI